MEKFAIPADIQVFCTTAKSFPGGVQEAFITLDKMLSGDGRTFYGVSYLTADGAIVYKAAVTESFKGEAEQYGFDSLVINKGAYLAETIC